MAVSSWDQLSRLGDRDRGCWVTTRPRFGLLGARSRKPNAVVATPSGRRVRCVPATTNLSEGTRAGSGDWRSGWTSRGEACTRGWRKRPGAGVSLPIHALQCPPNTCSPMGRRLTAVNKRHQRKVMIRIRLAGSGVGAQHNYEDTPFRPRPKGTLMVPAFAPPAVAVPFKESRGPQRVQRRFESGCTCSASCLSRRALRLTRRPAEGQVSNGFWRGLLTGAALEGADMTLWLPFLSEPVDLADLVRIG